MFSYQYVLLIPHNQMQGYNVVCKSVWMLQKYTYLHGSQVRPPGQSSFVSGSHSRGEHTHDRARATATDKTTMPPRSIHANLIFGRSDVFCLLTLLSLCLSTQRFFDPYGQQRLTAKKSPKTDFNYSLHLCNKFLYSWILLFCFW